MIVKTYSQVREGDYVRLHGHNVNPSAGQIWRKVTETTGQQITTVDRHGTERVFSWDSINQGRRRFKVWTPGDPREDGDNL